MVQFSNSAPFSFDFNFEDGETINYIGLGYTFSYPLPMLRVNVHASKVKKTPKVNKVKCR